MYHAHVKNTKDLTPKTFYYQQTVPQCDVTLWELVPTCVWTVVCELKSLPKDHSKAHMLRSNHVAMAVSLECFTTDSNIYTVVIENTESIASRCVGTHAALSVQVTPKCDMRLTVIPQWSENLPTLVLLYFVYGYDGWGINVCIHEDFRDLQPLSVFIQQHSYQGLAIPGCRRNSTIPTHYHSMLSYEVTASMFT
jgi:hypothetical protein